MYVCVVNAKQCVRESEEERCAVERERERNLGVNRLILGQIERDKMVMGEVCLRLEERQIQKRMKNRL